MRRVAPEDVGWRQRELVMSPADLRDYSVLLKDAFPGIQFVEKNWPKRGLHPPDVVECESIDRSSEREGHMVFAEDWTPRWEAHFGDRWYLGGFGIPYGTYERGGSTGRWKGGPENMHATLIGVMIEKGHKGDLAVARKVLRLLDKLIAPGMLQTVSYPGMTPIGEPYRNRWAARDAYRWCQEAPDRILGRQAHQTVGCRPAD